MTNLPDDKNSLRRQLFEKSNLLDKTNQILNDVYLGRKSDDTPEAIKAREDKENTTNEINKLNEKLKIIEDEEYRTKGKYYIEFEMISEDGNSTVDKRVLLLNSIVKIKNMNDYFDSIEPDVVELRDEINLYLCNKHRGSILKKLYSI